MISKAYGRWDWRPYFAWLPKEVSVSDDYDSPRVWVWLETVERKRLDHALYGLIWEYRLRQNESSSAHPPP